MKTLKHMMLVAMVAGMAACNDAGTADGDGRTTDTSSSATDTNNTTGTALAEKDAEFLSDVAASNMAEIKMGQLAQQKGNSQDVKDLGKMLETDHSAVLSEVRSFSSQHSVMLPGEEKAEAKDMHNKLNEKTGKEFDKDWCEHMIDAHEKSINKFESAQNDAGNADLKSWAANTLPKLRTHLDKLKECKAKLK
jgi:putative membrane protein